MIDFHDITVRDQRWIEPILHAANKPGADYTFTSMLFWTNYYGQVGRVGDFVCTGKGATSISSPPGRATCARRWTQCWTTACGAAARRASAA